MEQRAAQIKKRIAAAAQRSGRQASDITLVAVTKTVTPEVARQAFDLGLTNLGENRVQELKIKMQHIPEARWHMIGRLQTNKVKDVVGRVCLIHSVDRWNLAEEINKRGKLLNIQVPVLLEINIAGEEQKAGFNPNDVNSFLDSAGQLEAIRICGFMTVAPIVEDAEQTRPVFRELRRLKEELGKKPFYNADLKHLSMGMTADFEVAIEEGATIVRIGSALFQK
ncbi:MAG: YggS family pyridoxal phosphate-dependent enzyme [Syntrophomonadaceae bacterium]|jgi:pyridoxal phosphate enzyme (YggS family)